MSEPSSLSGIAIGTGVITLTGSVLGLQWDALLLGLFGGLLALQHLPPMTRWQVASSLFSASFLGATLSPFAEGFLKEYAKWATTTSPDAPRLAMAVVIGLCAQLLVPFIFRKLGPKPTEAP